jgi:type IV pilus assembly protein PilB
MSTLHANTAPLTVTRLVDMGCEPFMVSEALICVVAQRLARRVCTECAGPHAVPEETLVELRARAAAGGYVLPEKGIQFMRGKGCNRCKQWGYYGRTALHEVMVVDRVLRDMIAARRPEEEIRRAAIASGMKTLFADGFRKAAEGVTTVEEVLRVTFST